MRKAILFLTLVLGLLMLDSLSQSKHIEVSKNAGEPVTIDFWALPTDLTTFEGIVLESSPLISGPYVDTVLSTQKTDRSITFPSPAIPTYYRLYHYKTVNGVRQKSLSSNTVAVFITVTNLPTN